MVKIRNYYYAWEQAQPIEAFVEYYIRERYHKVLDNLIPADFYFDRSKVKHSQASIVCRQSKWDIGVIYCDNEQWWNQVLIGKYSHQIFNYPG